MTSGHGTTRIPAECFWTLETEAGPGGQEEKFVLITLAKKSSGYQSWDMLLESERVDMSITQRVGM
jgi:hypothetical protein